VCCFKSACTFYSSFRHILPREVSRSLVSVLIIICCAREKGISHDSHVDLGAVV